MSDTSDNDAKRLKLLLEVAKIQAQLETIHKRERNLVAKRSPLLQSLRDLGVTPHTIHQLTQVPLSTVYANTTGVDRRKRTRGGGKREER